MMASAAIAGEVQVGSISFPYGPYQTGRGGEFTLTPVDSDGNPDGWLDLGDYVSDVTSGIEEPGSFQSFPDKLLNGCTRHQRKHLICTDIMW